MTESRTRADSPYMEWAKTRSQAPFGLASSGVLNVPMSEFPARLEDLELTNPGGYGYGELRRRLAHKAGVADECVVQANGTSMANHLAMAACFEPGDEVLIEQPTYELLTRTAQFLGAKIRRLPRRFENGFQIDPADVKKNLTGATRLVVLTNMHNPSGVLIEEDVLREIGSLARAAGARVLLDEVYLDLAFDRAPPTSYLLDPETFVVTSSLTKAYGLSGLRCGWILAEPALAARMWRLNDLMDASVSHITERMSVIALDHLTQFAARTRELLAKSRAHLNSFLDSNPDLSAVRSEFGTLVFPRLPSGTADEFCEFLRANFETTVVPGGFFEMPQHFRLGIGGDPAMVAAGLERLGAALREWPSGAPVSPSS